MPESVEAATLSETVLELSPVGMLAIDRSGCIVLVNAQLARLFGYEKHELVGVAIDQLIPDPYQDAHADHRAHYFARPESRPMGSDRIVHGRRKDGSQFPVEVGLNVVESAGTHMVVASVADLSSRRTAEARFKAAFESALNGLIMTDEAGTIVLANQATERKFGYGPGELIGKSVDVLVPARVRDAHAANRGAFMAAPSERRMGSGRDLFGLRKDGVEFPVEIGLKPLVADGARFVLTTIVDITARKQLEARVRNSQRTEALGSLANGVAHDFNNILQSIVAVAEGALLDDVPAETMRAFESIVEVSSRGRDLVKRILSFSRNAELPRRPLRPDVAVEEVAAILRASLPAGIDLRLDIERGCPEVHSDPTLLHQVVMNLATNAIQAMAEDGGVLSICVDAVNLDSSANINPAASPGLFVRVVVEDTGEGMAAEVRERAFDPFFTTKRESGGSGLGLAVVKGIVDAHNGGVRIDGGQQGRGTRVEVYVPALVRGAPSGPDVDVTAPTVMFIDDEPIVGGALVRILNRSGFRATHFPSAIEALSAIADGSSWNVLLVDNAMPRMSGLEFLRAIRDRGIATPALMLTGHMPPEPAVLAELGVLDVLEKPIQREELVRALQAALCEPKPAL